MNFGCQADVFQFPHHRQYWFVSGNFWSVGVLLVRFLSSWLFLLTCAAISL